jgi:acyl-CoA synthetase (AMP-forming)/AMP-acid ligase II/acyl carrier protein
MQTIFNFICDRKASSPNKIFLEDGGALEFSPSRLHQQVAYTQQLLTEAGIQRDARVAILLPDGAALCLAFLGVSSHGIAAPLNPAASLPDLIKWLQDLEPAALVTGDGSPETATIAAAELGIPILHFDMSPTHSDLILDDAFIFPRPQDVALILHTSGTTAKPKMVPLTHANLLRSALNITETLCLVPDDVCLNVMPMFHIHGIVACLLAPLVSGGKVIVSEGIDAKSFFGLLKEKNATWYSAVPTRHANLLAHWQSDPTCIQGHRLRFIRSSSAALPVKVLERLESTFRVPVIEAYGMTEAAHQMCSNPLPPAKQKPGSVGLPAGPQLRVIDSQCVDAPIGTIGEVVIKGENVTLGYLNLPEEMQERIEGGWFRTGDLGHLDADGYLFLQGRMKEIVNRGGEKVSPAEVDVCLLTHDAVSEAASFGVQHPSLGEDLAAAVVLHPGMSTDEQAIRWYLFDRLSHFKIPSRILIVDSIPKSSIGKVQRNQLAIRLKQLLLSHSDKPINESERFLAQLFQEAIPGCQETGRKDNFFNLGGDSLHAIRVAHQIGDRFDIELPSQEIFRHPTPETLAIRIEVIRKEALLKSLETRFSSLSKEQVENLLKSQRNRN